MWNKIIDWSSNIKDRYKFVRDFNISAKNSFVNGQTHTLLEAKITIGSLEFRHTFSKFMAGGFRIKAFSGEPLQLNELSKIGRAILDN